MDNSERIPFPKLELFPTAKKLGQFVFGLLRFFDDDEPEYLAPLDSPIEPVTEMPGQ